MLQESYQMNILINELSHVKARLPPSADRSSGPGSVHISTLSLDLAELHCLSDASDQRRVAGTTEYTSFGALTAADLSDGRATSAHQTQRRLGLLCVRI